jgi:hypothetical protein
MTAGWFPVAGLSRIPASARKISQPVGRAGRPVQPRAARLPPLQYGELVAQDQDLCGLPRLLMPGEQQPRG